MINSKNTEVQRLIDDVSVIDESMFNLMNSMRDIVFEICPKVNERVMYGGIMFSIDKEDFGGLFVRKNHISFEFTAGFLMKDPQNFLEGSGKFRRHLKIRTMEDLVNKNLRFFVTQAVDEAGKF